MKKLFVLFIALVVLLTAAAAQAESRISVSGTGEIRVSADTAVISLGVNARDKDVLKAQQKVNESIAAIRAALTEQGISEENINTEFSNIYVTYDYRDDQEEVEAYNASSTLAIKVTEMDKVGALIDAAFSAGAPATASVPLHSRISSSSAIAGSARPRWNPKITAQIRAAILLPVIFIVSAPFFRPMYLISVSF